MGIAAPENMAVWLLPFVFSHIELTQLVRRSRKQIATVGAICAIMLVSLILWSGFELPARAELVYTPDGLPFVYFFAAAFAASMALIGTGMLERGDDLTLEDELDNDSA